MLFNNKNIIIITYYNNLGKPPTSIILYCLIKFEFVNL